MSLRHQTWTSKLFPPLKQFRCLALPQKAKAVLYECLSFVTCKGAAQRWLLPGRAGCAEAGETCFLAAH